LELFRRRPIRLCNPSVFDLKLREVARRLDRSEAQVRAVFGTYDVISLERAHPDG